YGHYRPYRYDHFHSNHHPNYRRHDCHHYSDHCFDPHPDSTVPRVYHYYYYHLSCHTRSPGITPTTMLLTYTATFSASFYTLLIFLVHVLASPTSAESYFFSLISRKIYARFKHHCIANKISASHTTSPSTFATPFLFPIGPLLRVISTSIG